VIWGTFRRGVRSNSESIDGIAALHRAVTHHDEAMIGIFLINEAS